MSGSDDSIEYIPEEGPNHTPGPVSPNADLMTSQPTNFSSSISNTSVDDSNASESVNESLTSEPDMVPALSFVDEIGRRRIRDRVRSRARSRSGAHSNAELAGLRTVPASTNLIPRDDSEVARPPGNRRPWSAPRTRLGLPASSTRLPFPYDAPVRGSGYWMSRTRTGSPASSTSGSEALSPLPPHIAEYARELRGNGDVPPFQAATIAFNVSQMVIDMEARLPMTPERRRRIRRHRRAQDRARAQAQDVLSEVIDISPSSSGNDSGRRPERQSERQPPRNVPAQVRRRGNSVSDCSQCSSDEESNDKKSKPDPLEEWLYPV